MKKLIAWEENAPVTGANQLLCLEAVAKYVAAPRSLPVALQGHAEGSDIEGAHLQNHAGASDSSSAPVPAAAPQTKEGFHSWFADVGAKVAARNRAQHESHLKVLVDYNESCKQLVDETASILTRLDDMRASYQVVQSKTQEVHEQCAALLREKTELVAYADAIRTKMNYYDELDRIGAIFSVATVDIIKDPKFTGILERLDECIAYVSVNAQYHDAQDVGDKFRTLQARGLSFVAENFKAVLRDTTAQLLPEIQRSMSAQAPLENKKVGRNLSDESVLYAKYRAVADPLKGFMGEIACRRATNELCADLLLDCQSSYLQIRQTVVGDIVRSNLQSMRDAFAPSVSGDNAADTADRGENVAELTAFARQGWHYMMRICELEYKLWGHFFPEGTPTQGLRSLVEAYNTLLYDYLRPMYIHESTFEELVDCVHVLKNELLEDEMGRRGAAASFCQSTVQRSIQDLQEKLIFFDSDIHP